VKRGDPLVAAWRSLAEVAKKANLPAKASLRAKRGALGTITGSAAAVCKVADTLCGFEAATGRCKPVPGVRGVAGPLFLVLGQYFQP
jgi:hypothetical protein